VVSDELDLRSKRRSCAYFRWPKTDSVFFVDQPYSMNMGTGSQIASTEVVEDWMHDRKALVGFGCIKYTDSFEGQYQTNFCSYAMINPIFPEMWKPCYPGNRAK
jgi:hypothetical protein